MSWASLRYRGVSRVAKVRRTAHAADTFHKRGKNLY